MNQVHVLLKEKKWCVVVDGKDEVVHQTDTQESAIDFAREFARENKMELTIHGEDGAIRKKDSSGEGVDDPNAPDHT